MTLHTTFFGPISWYRQLLSADSWTIDEGEPYVKQTTRNHCLIATVSGVQKLTVPVEKSRSEERGARNDFSRNEPLLTRDVRISEHGKWRTEHWNALCTAYGESPFFDYYADDLRPFFERRDWELLIDYNAAITEKVLELLDAPSNLPQLGEAANGLFSCGRTIKNAPLSSGRGVGGEASYWQVYQSRHGFPPDLSILDLLCCMGPEAILYLRN